MPRWLAVLLTLVLFAAMSGGSGPAVADPVTMLARCGPSTGQSYYFEAGVVGPGQGGWKPDGYENGRITAYLNDKGDLDLIVRDANTTRSYLKSGYRVVLNNMSKEDRAFMITAFGEGFVETYLFRTNEYGVGTVAWTSNKLSALVIRNSIMSAECGPKYAINQ